MSGTVIDVQVGINAFHPKRLLVRPGTTVRFRLVPGILEARIPLPACFGKGAGALLLTRSNPSQESTIVPTVKTGTRYRLSILSANGTAEDTGARRRGGSDLELEGETLLPLGGGFGPAGGKGTDEVIIGEIEIISGPTTEDPA